MTTTSFAAPVKPSLGSAIGWGAFLACSWTWCIGMFLPVLLVRDYGIWGWIVFAVPNVIGAAAMGSIPRDGGALRRLVERHPGATRLFSLVTIAFHLFFNGWMIQRLVPEFGPPVTVVLAISMYLAISSSSSLSRRDVGLALAVFVASVLAMVVLALVGILSAPVPLNEPGTGGGLISLAAVCAFGFLLCPYLDLTFHRAREAAGARAASAFVIGFGVLFLLILLFSLRYAPFLAPIINDPAGLRSARTPAIILGIYISLQSAFTIAVHARELIPTLTSANRSRYIAFAVVAFLVPMILAIVSTGSVRLFGFAAGEVFYRCFMGFYGLYFPAYVYLCIIPRRVGVVVYGITVALATPLFFAAFVLNHMLWLLPALGIVLLAKLFSRAPVSV